MLNITGVRVSYGAGITAMVHGGVTSFSRWLTNDDIDEHSKWKGVKNVHFYLAANYIKLAQQAGERIDSWINSVRALTADCFANSEDNSTFNNAFILGAFVVGVTAIYSYFGHDIATNTKDLWRELSARFS